MSYPTVTLLPRKEVPVLGGHPWVFSKGIREPKASASQQVSTLGVVPVSAPDLAPGSLVTLLASDGRGLGIGTYNPLTNIRVRLITRDTQQTIDQAFFEKRFAELTTWKQNHLPPNTNGYRLVHAETDSIPGLIIDRYGSTFVFQLHTAGMEHFRTEIIEALKTTFSPRAIVERSDIEVRKQEGLTDMPITVHHGDITGPVTFQENGISFYADTLHGQKTGFFLDQRDARAEVGNISANKRVLNLFSYSGAYSVYAAKNGATQVTSIDISKPALDQAKQNFKLNHLDPNDTTKYAFEDHDIFDIVGRAQLPHGPYDVIVCDPPALAKTEAHVQNASKAYLMLNQHCFTHLEKGGVLITSSCSGRISQEEFRDILRIAAGRAGKQTKILKWITQPADHAELLAFTEGRYLKTAIIEVV